MSEISAKRKELGTITKLCEMCKTNEITIRQRYGRRKYCDNCILERGKISHILNPKKEGDNQKEYQKNKERYKERDKYKDKNLYSIRQHTSYLERKGEVKKDEKCSFCLSNVNLLKHHPDYKQPNRFVTLCKDCHNKLHNTKVLFNDRLIKETHELGKKEGVEMARKELLNEIIQETDFYYGFPDNRRITIGTLKRIIDKLKQSLEEKKA